MLLHQFKFQEKQRKIQLLFENGVYLAVRYTKEYHILLFSVESFYCEVYFDFDEQEIGYIRAFTDLESLSPFLDSINISPALPRNIRMNS